MDEPAETQRRKRGGQPGNRNAVQHGLYSRQLGVLQGRSNTVEGLTDQIAMLRLAVREMVQRAEADPKPETDLELLRAVTVACTAINRLVRTHKFLAGIRKRTGDADTAPLPAWPMEEVSGEELAEARRAGLEWDIRLLTDLIERVTSQQQRWKTLGESAAAVRGLALANGTLARLVRTQRRIQAVGDPVQRTLNELNEMSRWVEEFDEEGWGEEKD